MFSLGQKTDDDTMGIPGLLSLIKNDWLPQAQLCKDRLFYAGYLSWLVLMVCQSSFISLAITGAPAKLLRYACVLCLVMSELVSGEYTVKSLAIALLPAGFFLTPLLPTSSMGYYVVCWLALAALHSDGACKENVTNLVIIALITASCFMARDHLVMDGMLIVWCARKRELREVITAGFAAVVLSVCLVLVLCAIGVLDNYIIDYDTRQRWALGFRFVLFPSMYLCLITLIVVWLRGNNITILETLVILGLNVIVFLLTNARISFCCALLSIVCSVILRFIYRKRAIMKPIRMLCTISFVACAILGIAITLLYTPASKPLALINRLLVSRLELGSNALRTYGVTAFGQIIDFVGFGLDETGAQSAETVNYVDCLYVNLLVHHGVVGLLSFVGLNTWACIKAWRRHDDWLLLALAMVAVHALVDDLVIYLYYNLFYFAILCPYTLKGEKEKQYE